MHDLDRTQLEFEAGNDAFETDSFEYEDALEADEVEGEMPFDEVEEMDLASELLEITDEAELDQFLGKLIKKAGRAAGRFIKSPIGRQLGGMLKSVAKKALPVLGGALGNMIVPGAGGIIGSKLASSAGSMFGLEIEGLSNEDQEFEVARQYVRFAGAAAKKAATAPATVSAPTAARNALVSSARRFAPGLLQSNGRSQMRKGSPIRGRRGTWIRRGKTIILYES